MDKERGPGSGGTQLLDNSGKMIGDTLYQIPGHQAYANILWATAHTNMFFHSISTHTAVEQKASPPR